MSNVNGWSVVGKNALINKFQDLNGLIDLYFQNLSLPLYKIETIPSQI
jgi:hypothetical protein